MVRQLKEKPLFVDESFGICRGNNLNVFENTQPSVSPDGWVAGKDESQDVQMLVLAEGCWMMEWIPGDCIFSSSLILGKWHNLK